MLLLPDLLLLDFALGLSDFFESFLFEEDEVELLAFVEDDFEVDPVALLLELPLAEVEPAPVVEEPLFRELLLVLLEDDEVGLVLDELLFEFVLLSEF